MALPETDYNALAESENSCAGSETAHPAASGADAAKPRIHLRQGRRPMPRPEGLPDVPFLIS